MICHDMPNVYSACGGKESIRAYVRRGGRRRIHCGRIDAGPCLIEGRECRNIDEDRRIPKAICRPRLLFSHSV